MEFKLKNPKGTKDYMPKEQILRNSLKATLEEVFQCYGYGAVETPTLCYYDMLASKYAGGVEILKEVYRLQDQGQRDLGLRYDLTVPFAKIIGMNPEMRLPFKRYEIGKVFRDGPVKRGRIREFIQCDVDVVGIRSMLAEAELLSMVFDAFDRLQLEVYISYNNRKLLSGIIFSCNIDPDMVNEVILTIDKLEKIEKEGVRQELISKGLSTDQIEALFLAIAAAAADLQHFVDCNSSNPLILEGGKELKELNQALAVLQIDQKVRFNPCLARGLDIYTGTVFEVFLSDGSISSSVAGGGRYDNIIGSFLNNGRDYPAVGLSFGLDVIHTALLLKGQQAYKNPLDLYIIPLGTDAEAFKLASSLRSKGYRIDLEMSGRKLKKSLEYASKEGISTILILGEDELAASRGKLKNMLTGEEISVNLNNLEEFLNSAKHDTVRTKQTKETLCGIH